MSTLTRVRLWLALFVAGLVVSGVTAFPLEAETRLLARTLDGYWFDRVAEGVAQTNLDYPFMAYGTDWLAFAHLVIAVAFWGPIRDPVRNVWVVHWGMISCAAVVPLALIAGTVRGIPWGWRLIDISFGVIGIVPLLFALRGIRELARHSPPE
ncbi:hypothetical protein [Virgisporangium aurantiacum]|uniref:Uncharacterized protein n=1 Tax=Virgisporangium aurantiacum TaxID=175570 RepID=A0A8J3ZJQ4_9ACTN|nr:hypothetical protein [Virgisporangium aurantiacum]GIJ62781.1 hypothetical protein Vau01_102970 [Virgisporangium aurantiacum]